MNRTLQRRSMLLVLLGTALSTSCGSGNGNSQSASAKQGGRGASEPQAVEVTTVVSQKLSMSVRLPGEIIPYESVAVFPKVSAFVKSISVDRGSSVKTGQEIVRLDAPELVSQKQEAQSKLQAAEAQRAEVEAKLASDQSTFLRLKAAAATPGVVAGNDVEVAQQTAAADRARLRAAERNLEAAKAALSAIGVIESYLRVTAPFEGVVTERNVHPGALVGPSGNEPMVRIEKISRLRLVLPVPENYVSGTIKGARVTFTVSTFPGEKFTGTIARVSDSLDIKTRTMPVELDVMNPSDRLAPGMYPEVDWPVQRPHPTLFVPGSSIARTNERRFVVRIRDGKAEWIDVETGLTSDKLVEVFGDLHEGDLVAARGTDEIKPGTPVRAQDTSAKAQ
jgi:membrane fusion protein (multidrug efflux system)